MSALSWTFWIGTPTGGYGPHAQADDWEDMKEPVPAWSQAFPDEVWKSRAGTRKAAKVRRAATSVHFTAPLVTLDVERCVWKPHRMTLIGTVRADTPDEAFALVMRTARWTMQALYGHRGAMTSDDYGFPMADADVQIRRPPKPRAEAAQE